VRLALLAIVIALAYACGHDGSSNDAAGEPCTAIFGGGFTETDNTASVCPTLGSATGSSDLLLDFTIDSRVLGAQMLVSIDLGPTPTTGEFSSETITSWHAVGARSIGNGGCVYSAGDQVVPTGSFTLTLTAIEATTAHGSAAFEEYVHALDGTNCGPADVETLMLGF
jgi:hypothetical protein